MRTTFLLIFLTFSILGKSQIAKEINVETAGSLSTLLTESEKSTVTDLTVTGTINALDIKCMRDQITYLTNIDLSDANIAAFDGIALSSVSYSYPANEMPRSSFYNGTAGKAKITLVSILLPSSLTSIGEYAFYLCENIKSINIGNLITNIGSRSFMGCYGLTAVTMGPSVITIQREAFQYCYALKNITFSENITYIGEDAFTHCAIDKVVFPNSMTTIDDAFRQCDYLKEVTIPTSITNISNWAFEYCYGLNTIFSLNTTPPVCEAYSFYLVPNVTSVYVPASSVNAYKSAPVWGDNFYSVIKPIPSITAFSIPTQIGSASINEADKTILVTLPYTTTLNNLIATYTLSAGATAKIGTTVQTSGTTANDFSSPVVYAITSEDGLVTENWTVNVTIANTLANITSFTIPNQTGSTVINEEDSTISVTLPYSISVDNLIASFTLSAGAIARVDTTIQTSGTTANDFTSPVVYAIISEDGLTIKNWTVNVTIAKNTLANIISFSIPNQTGDTVINEEDRTISVTLPYGTSANNLVAIYTLSAGATAKVGTTIQTSGITANDFTSPVVYTITSEDGLTSNNWTVNVSQITGVNSILNSIETKVFPNPSEGIFKLRLKSSEYVNIKFEIINSLGTIILNRKVNFSGEKDELIDLSHASKGIYFLRICTDNNQEQLKLLLK